MNPHQKNKVDVSSLSPEEQRLFRLYGKLPSRSDHFAKHLKERKYFDSGDYAMSKAGKGDGVDAGSVGSQHPVPEDIPHLSSPVNAGSTSSTGGPPLSVSPTGGNPALGSVPKHHSSVSGMQASSPVKEGSFLSRETSMDDGPADSTEAQLPASGDDSANADNSEAIPIRR